MPSRFLAEKELAKHCFTILIVALLMLGLAPVVLGGDPSMSDLTGTDSSTNNDVSGAKRRFDIDGVTGTQGMQYGEDPEHIAHLMKMATTQIPSGGPSTVATSDVNHATLIATQRKTFYANGRYWVFCSNGSDMVYCTSTDGSSWSSAAAVRPADSGNSFSIWFDGTYVHYAVGGLYYRRGTPNSDGTITWSAAEQYVPTTYGQSWWPFVCGDTNGYAWIGYADPYFTAYPYVIKSGNNDGTWGTTPSGFPYQLSTTVNESIVEIVPLTGGKMLAMYHKNGDVVKSERWNGSAWGSEKATTLKADQFYSAVAQGDDVHLVFNKVKNSTSPNQLIYTKYTYASDAWGAETNVQTLDYWDQYPVLGRNPANNDLYVFWAGYPDAHHIYYKRYYGGSWDASPTDWISEPTLTSNESLTCFYQSYGDKIGLEYLTETSSPYDVRFAYLNISTINGFQVPGMSTNDQYEIDFTIGAKDFSMLFISSGGPYGSLKLFYKDAGAPTWSSGETLNMGTPITSGVTYWSFSQDTGFRLTNSTASADGSVKMIVKKSYLTSLGATGNDVSNVFSTTFVSGTGEPGNSTIATFNPSADSYMHSDSPDTNYGSDDYIYMRRYYTYYLVRSRAIMRFDLSSIPTSAYVVFANLSLYVNSTEPSVSSRTVGAHKVQQRDWTELGVTWNKYDGTNSWTTPGGDFNATATSSVTIDASGRYYGWTVTSDVQNFVQMPSTNYGWVLKLARESIGDPTDYVIIQSRENTNKPRLTVRYSTSTSTPNDRCPSSSGASWTMSGTPELPLGPLVLVIPAAAIYLYLKRHSRIRVSTHVGGSS